MANIKKILATDKKFRKVGIIGDLYTIDTLISDQTLDYDFPTLCDDNNSSNILINSITKFKKVFNEKFPYLKDINMENLLIGGGCVSNIVRGHNSTTSDIDFFIYGLTPKKATERVKEWIIDILFPKKYNKNNDNDDDDDDYSDSENSEPKSKSKPKLKVEEYKLIRNNNTLAIHLVDYDIKIQFIFRLYKNISEILHGFDLGSSAIGYNGENVYFTTLGKFCHEYSCNIIDTTRRSTTYEYRLNKYFDRGFNIVLPNLNIDKLPKSYFKYGESEICELSHFVFGYSNITGNRIKVTRIHNQYGNKSDYEHESMDLTNLYYQSQKINIINLINDVDYFYYVSSGITRKNIDILTKPPCLDKGIIIKFYDNLREKINGKNIDITLLNQYFTVETTKNIVGNIFNKKKNTKEYLDELVEKQKQDAFKKLRKLLKQDHTQIKWLKENPGTQLTSSFNPIIEDEKEWYGKRYYL